MSTITIPQISAPPIDVDSSTPYKRYSELTISQAGVTIRVEVERLRELASALTSAADYYGVTDPDKPAQRENPDQLRLF